MTRLFKIRSKAAKKGHAARQKATCVICGKGIWNRMVLRTTEPGYAHTGCTKGAEGWERVW
jgi:hypothetical protein